jgi:hypothetical protein
MEMTFLVAGCALLMALLAGIVLDGVGVGGAQKARREFLSFDEFSTR